jgi:hypothetical protein
MIRTVTTIVAAALALVLASTSPALAADNKQPSGKKGCTITTTRDDGKEAVWNFNHGDIVEFRSPTGHVYSKSKCNDGKWEETMFFTAPSRALYVQAGQTAGIAP